ncbi:hypothetical protein [Legionella septentrionalis]|nr:hypothetical protein [Legionella septentrionalis]
MLYRASLSAEEYTRLLDENGLKTLLHKMQDAQCGDATVWIAQK